MVFIFRLDIIKESLTNPEILKSLEIYYESNYIEDSPYDDGTVWDTNIYKIKKDELFKVFDILQDYVKNGWRIRAFKGKEIYELTNTGWSKSNRFDTDETNEILLHFEKSSHPLKKLALERFRNS